MSDKKYCSVIESELNVITEVLISEVPYINCGNLIRSKLALLILLANRVDISKNIYDVIISGELIHTASLLHDDVIDEDDYRRNSPSLRTSLGNKNSIIIGNQTLTKAIDRIIKLNSIKILDVYNRAISDMCKGEMMQISQTGNIPTFENYITKSKLKTASLFSAILEACELYSGVKLGFDVVKFGELYGLGYQIRNDLINVKTTKSDIKNGIYTAPVIFSKSETVTKDAIEKTLCLIDNCIKEALDIIKEVRDSEYKQVLIEVIKCLRI